MILIYANIIQFGFSGFPGGSAGEESPCNSADLGSIPGLRRSPGEGNGYPYYYSGLENFMDCIVHGVTKSRTRLSNFHFTWIFWPCPMWLWQFSRDFYGGGSDLSMGTPPRLNTFLASWFKLVSVCWSSILRCCLSHGSRVRHPHCRPRLVSLRSASAGTSQGVGSYRAVPRGRGGGSIQNQRLDWIHSNLCGFGNPCVWGTALSTGL